MATERNWGTVLPQPFTANGSNFGLITVADTAGFRTKQVAAILSNTLPPLSVQVKIVLSKTEMIVGSVDNKIGNWPPLNISAYTVGNDASIGAQWQAKNNIGVEDAMKAVYESDPVVAIRTLSVDQYGTPLSSDNPLPVTFDGTISIGSVEVHGSNGNIIEPNSDGSLNVVIENASSIGTVINTYGTTSVASNATTQLVSYTVPLANTGQLQISTFSGDNIGTYSILINGIVQDTLRTMFGTSLSGTFLFSAGASAGLPLSAGDVITVTANNPRPTAATYNARIQVLVNS